MLFPVSYVFNFMVMLSPVAPPDVAKIQEGLKEQLGADTVTVSNFEHRRVLSDFLFPAKAYAYSVKHGLSVRTPEFYGLKFIAAKGAHEYAFNCDLREYGESHQGDEPIRKEHEVYVLKSDCVATNLSANSPEVSEILKTDQGFGPQKFIYYRKLQ